LNQRSARPWTSAPNRHQGAGHDFLGRPAIDPGATDYCPVVAPSRFCTRITVTACHMPPSRTDPQYFLAALAGAWLEPENRCLVPANSFAEYAPEPNPASGKKDIVWFALNDDRPLFAFGGIWT
jgi:hypothetical protein